MTQFSFEETEFLLRAKAKRPSSLYESDMWLSEYVIGFRSAYQLSIYADEEDLEPEDMDFLVEHWDKQAARARLAHLKKRAFG